jgi:AcrR family transcriptional regulator
MPRVTEEHLEARRRQILDAAVACFAHEGFHRTTIPNIAREAGLSAGAIYRYFESKDELIEAIADERHARERELLESVRGVSDPAAALAALAREFFGLLDDPDERLRRRVGVQVWAEALRNPAILALVRRGAGQPLAELTRVVRSAQQGGQLPAELDPAATARVLMSGFYGLVLQQAWDEEDVDVEAYLRAASAIIRAVTAQGTSG